MANYVTKSFTAKMPDGISKRIRVYGKDDAEAKAKLDRKKLEYEMGVLVVNSNTTLKHWVEEWLEIYKRPRVGDAKFKHIKGCVQKYFTSKIGHMRLCEIKPLHIQYCLNELQGYSKEYITTVKNYINSIMEQAVIDDLIKENPVKKIKQLPEGKETYPRRPLTEQEYNAFMKAIDSHEKGLMFAASLACGLRPGEVRALRWDDIDLVNRNLSINFAVETGKNTLKAPKSKAGIRTIPMPDWFYNRLLSAIRDISTPFVFFGTKEKPITKQRYERAWSSFLRKMDIYAGAKLYRNEIINHAISQDLTPYYLRHTYATRLVEAGVDMKTAQYLLGHSSIKVTAQIYTHVTSKMLETARDKINAVC